VPVAGTAESQHIEGQLNARERELLTNAILNAAKKPRVAIEVGTWLGGGSTLHILRALQRNGEGHLWGIEADRSIYDRMLANLRAAAPEALHRFTPLFGFSQKVIPQWIASQPSGFQVDFAFLDGGNNPMEQILEFRLLDPHIPTGGQLMAHDAKLRKGKWLRPYLSLLDHWKTEIHDISDEGLLYARKVAEAPSARSRSAARRKLLAMRLHPVEVAAAVLPRSVCGFLLGLLPRRTSTLLADGRRTHPGH
jgi:predicted O-methyltransferase YrrM